MNLTKLFEAQRKLDEHIIREKGLEGQDLLPKKILALLVELGELANEWRGFKYWSNNQGANTVDPNCQKCKGSGSIMHSTELGIEHEDCDCPNPLLEEYVDCLHFILSIGLDLGIYEKWVLDDWDKWSFEDEIDAFLEIFKNVYRDMDEHDWWSLWEQFLSLGERLGFTWDEIEEAYFRKNKINHERQENGY